QEIQDQPRACRAALQRLDGQREQLARRYPFHRYEQVLLTGCGSSLNLGMIAQHMIAKLNGVSCRAVPASELLLYPRTYLPGRGKTLVLAISRTGETSETLLAVRKLKRQGAGELIAFTCYDDKALVRLADLSLVFSEGEEHSVVMTKAFTVLLLGIAYLADLHAGGANASQWTKIPAVIEESLRQNGERMRRLAQDDSLTQFIFLGTGPRYGLARESMLKIQEMAADRAEAHQTLEFRHGHKAILNHKTLVVIFSSKAERSYLNRLSQEIKQAGARILLLGSSLPDDLLSVVDDSVTFGGRVKELFGPIYLIHLMQLLAFWRAILAGRNPDQPELINRVVTLPGDHA
ncbi:MAG: SIS domain-containing protein, partial [Acidobacteria bacterium]|nr:SIS domain-containing protein [Acidobacteriota bacterium]